MVPVQLMLTKQSKLKNLEKCTMSGKIWVCDFQFSLIYQFRTASDSKGSSDRPGTTSASSHASQKGTVLSRANFPSSLICTSNNATEADELPDFFIVADLVVVSERFASILRNSSAASCDLIEVSIFQGDKANAIQGNWFFLDFRHEKRTFFPISSSGVRRVNDTDLWIVKRPPEPGGVTVSTEGLIGSDIWVESNLMGAFFVHDRLKSRIDANRIKGLTIIECTVI